MTVETLIEIFNTFGLPIALVVILIIGVFSLIKYIRNMLETRISDVEAENTNLRKEVNTLTARVNEQDKEILKLTYELGEKNGVKEYLEHFDSFQEKIIAVLKK